MLFKKKYLDNVLKWCFLIGYGCVNLSCAASVPNSSKQSQVAVVDKVNYRISWPNDKLGRGSNRIAIAEKSDLIAVAGKRYGLHLYSIQSRNLVKQLVDPEDPEYKKAYPSDRGIYALAFTPDESLLISGDEASQIKIWNVKQARLVKSLDAAAGRINSFAIFNGGDLLAVATQSGQLQVWDLTSYKKIHSHPGAWYDKYNKYLPANSIVFAPNKNQFIFSAECGVFWWNYRNSSQNPIKRFKEQSYASCEIVMSPSGKYLSMPDKLWDLETDQVILKITESYQAKLRGGEKIDIETSTFSRGEKSLIALTNDIMIIVLDIKTGTIKSKRKMLTGGPVDNRLRLLGDNKTLVILSDTIHFLDLNTGEELFPTKPVTTKFITIMDGIPRGGPYTLSMDGNVVVMGTTIRDGNTLRIKNEIKIPNLYINGVRDVAISPDNRIYAACVHSKKGDYIKLWDLKVNQALSKITSNCLEIIFSENEDAFFYLDYDLIIRKVDTKTYKTIYTIDAYKRILTGTEDVPRTVDMGISNDYLYLAINTKYHHGYIARHNLNNGKLNTYIKHADLSWIGQMTLSKDRRYLAINTFKLASDKATVIVFDTASKKVISRLKQLYAGSTALAISPDNRRLFAAYGNYLLNSWSIPEGKLNQPIRFGWGGHNSGVKSLIFSPMGDRLYIGGKIWDMKSQREVKLGH